MAEQPGSFWNNPAMMEALMIMGGGIKDAFSRGGGNSANFALQNVMAQRKQREQQQAVQQLGQQFAPQQFASPTGPNNAAPMIGTAPRTPDMSQIAPILLQNPQLAGPFMEMLKAQQGPAPNLTFAPNGQVVDLSNPAMAGQNFAAPVRPNVQFAPNGRAVDTTDPNIVGQDFGAPAQPTTAAKLADELGLQGPARTQFIRDYALKPQVQINQPPSGYTMDPKNPGGLMAIPGGPADPNRPQPPTQDQLKNQQLYLTSERQLEIVDKNFDELTRFGSQVGGKVNPALTSPGYQQAKAAISDIIANFIYSVSGATANPGEVATRTEIAIPFIGEAGASIADKKKRIAAMVESIRIRAQGGSMEQAAQQFEDALKPKSGPKPGTIEDGYRFKGGNPSDPNAWEKVS